VNAREVNLLIDEGEGFSIEFKRRVPSPEKIARTLIAFANTKGGVILFGVDDDGSVVGVESEKAEIELIRLAGTEYSDPLISPEVDVVAFDGRDVIVCRVTESHAKPHRFLGPTDGTNGDGTQVYIRVNDKTMAASREVVKILRNESPEAPAMTVGIGENERRLFQYLEQHERITVREFSKLVNISSRRASRILVQLVRTGVVRIHTHEKEEFFTLAYDVKY
jgi:predicted HTH transcriptional regulator